MTNSVRISHEMSTANRLMDFKHTGKISSQQYANRIIFTGGTLLSASHSREGYRECKGV